MEDHLLSKLQYTLANIQKGIATYVNITIPITSFSTDLHAIAAIRSQEKYNNLAEGFRDMFAAINSYIHAPVITINGNNYTLEFLCADYKVHPM